MAEISSMRSRPSALSQREMDDSSILAKLYHYPKKDIMTSKNGIKKDSYYRLLAESSSDIFLTQNLRGEIIYVNPAWTNIVGHSIEETQGKSIFNFISPEYNTVLEKRLEKKGDIDTYEIEILSKTGEKIPLEIRSTPIKVDTGEPEEILFVARDLREKKIAEKTLIRSKASYQDLFNSIDDAIYIQDREGRFLDVNEGAVKLYGIPKEEIIGKTPLFLSAPGKNDFEDIAKKIEKAFDGESQEFEFWGKKSNGEIFPKEVYVYKGSYFGKDVVITLARDSTKHKNIEAALQRQLKELNILQATAYASTQALDPKDIVRQITNIIGNTLYPDNFGILLLDKDTQTLHPHASYQGIPIDKKSKPSPLSRGVTEKVILTGKALRVGDVRKFADYIGDTPSIRSELCVPLKIGEKVLGVINAESSKKDFFTADDERLLITIAGQTAMALEKNRLLETEKKRRRIAEKLQESAAILTTTLNQDEAINLILKELSQVVSFDSASVQLLKKGYLEIMGGRGMLVLEKEKNRRFPYPADNPNTVVMQTGLPLILKNAPKAYPAFLEMPSIQSWLGVPLIVQDNTIGILTLDSGRLDYFTEEDSELVKAFANHAATAIQNAILFNAEKSRRKESDILGETALAVTASLNLAEAVEHILKQLSRVLPYDSASVQILEDNDLVIFGGRGWQNPADVEKMRFSLDGSNPNTRVIREKKIFILDDAQAEHAPFRSPPHDHIRSWMGVPLIIRDKVVGMLAIDSKEKSCFTEESTKVAQSFAYQAAIAIENARLFDAEQKRRQEAETLRQSAHTISSSLNLEEVLSTILASIKRVIPYDSATIMLLEEDKVRITGGYGLPNIEHQVGKVFPAQNFLLEKLIANAHPLILVDAQKKRYFKKWAETDYVRGWMGVPLVVRSKVIGCITLDSREVGAYTEKDAELAQTFAHQAASAIENAHLYEKALKTAERHAILHRLSQDILRDIDSAEKTYQAIHRSAEKLMPCDVFTILLRGDAPRDDDNAVFLIDQGKRYGAIKIPRESSLVFLSEKAKGSFIDKDLSIENPQIEKTHFGSRKRARSQLVSPMYIGNRLIGVLSVQNYTPDTYSEEEKILLEMLASHAASAIENARLFYETVQRGKEFAEIYRITQDLVAPQDVSTLLKNTLERAALLLGVSCANVYLYDTKTKILNPAISYELPKKHTQKAQSISIPKGEGLAGHVAKTLEAFRVNNYHAWEGRSPQFQDVNITSALGVPMLYAGNLIGVMDFYEIHPNTHHFTEADERVMSLLSTQVAGAIHSAKQFEQIKNRLAELEAINQTSTALRSAENTEDILSILLKEVRNSLGIKVASIWLNDSKTKGIYQAVACGWVKEIRTKRHKNDVGIIGHIFQSGEAYATPNLKDDTHLKVTKDEKIPAGWRGAWVPIRSTDSIIGVIAIVAETPREFSEEDLRLLTTLAEMGGNAIQRARLHKYTEKQVKRLTALRNIDAAISANFDLRTTLQLLVDHTVSQLNVDAANILLTMPFSETLEYFVGRGYITKPFSAPISQIEEPILNKAIQERRLQHTTSLLENKKTRRSSWFLAEDFRTYYCAPLIAKGNILGILEVFQHEVISPTLEWEDFLQTLAGQAAIAIDNDHLLRNLAHSNKELSRAYDITLEGWGKALELRDEDTQNHTENVTELTLQLAREIGISEDNLVHVHRGALLHDIGKMGIPDNILRKPGPLTKDEWKIMKQHPQLAYNMISPIPYLLPALDIPYCHHERWDGGGYPRGLKGENIPLAARIFTIVDVWDALLSDRPYRVAWEKKTVMDYIRNESGSRFDPKIVEVFIKMISNESPPDVNVQTNRHNHEIH